MATPSSCRPALGEPPSLLTALSEARRNYRGITVSQILPLRKYGYIDPETVEHVRHSAYFFGGATRPAARKAGLISFPAYFSELPMLLKRGLTPSDVVFTLASPMDEHGYFSLSLAPDYTMAAIEKARVVVLEVNPNVPFRQRRLPYPYFPGRRPDREQRSPARSRPAEDRPGPGSDRRSCCRDDSDGATLQIGYGGIPDAVVMQLTHKHDLASTPK